MPAAFPVTEAPSIVRDRSGALSRALHGALSRLAGRHSGRAFSSLCETATRPLLALLSQDESRPRAPLRLLQVVVSTSTTTDHSDISIRGNPRSGRLPGLERKSPSVSRQPPELLGVRGRANRCPAFSVAIARARDFAPTPIAPGTWCRETPLPAGLERRGGGGWRCRRRAPLQGAPAGRVAWHRTSAKRPGVDQPEVPSITQAFASERTVPTRRV
jgi:hypothetical protein